MFFIFIFFRFFSVSIQIYKFFLLNVLLFVYLFETALSILFLKRRMNFPFTWKKRGLFWIKACF